jgi:hypothetical protein
MKRAGWIVTKGGKPCTLVRVPKAKADVLIVGAPVAFFADLGEVDVAIAASMRSVSQLRGTRSVRWPVKKKALVDPKLFAILPLQGAGKP